MSAYCGYSHFSAMLDRTGVDWWLFMFDFESYWDNSEATPATNKSPAFPMTIAACYVATKEQWDEFKRNWDDARKEESFDVFHMTDFMAKPEYGVKPFCDWNQVKRDRVYYRLASIINTRIRMGFALALPVEAFEVHTPQYVKDDLGKRHFTFVVRGILDWIRQWYAVYGQGKAVQYIFDRMSKGNGEITAIFDLMKEHPELSRELGALPHDPDGLSFQNKEFFKPLQAADILAWNMRSFMQDEISRGLPPLAPTRLRPYFDILWRDRPNLHRPMRIGFFRDSDLEKGAIDMRDYEQREGKRPYTMSRRKLKEREKNNG